MQPIRYGILGAGAAIFETHAAAIRTVGGEIVALYNRTSERGQAKAAAIGCPFYADYRALLAAEKLDAAIIITAHPLHPAMTLDCLAAGCHVLVEKPMAVHVGEADAVIAAAKESDRVLAVCFQQRFRPEIAAAYDLIQTGRLGAIQRVEMTAPWPRTAVYYRESGWRATWAGEGGGVLLNQGAHDLDLLCYLLGMPARVMAWTRTHLHQIETEDTVHAMLEWANGALGYFHASTAEAGESRLRIAGTGGEVTISPGIIRFEEYETDLRKHIAQSPAAMGGPASRQVPLELTHGVSGHEAVYRDFEAAIRTDARPLADGESGRMSLELANAMIYSSHSGREVELPLDREAYQALLSRLQQKYVSLFSGRKMNEQDLLSRWEAEAVQPFAGWDFSYLEGRYHEDALPWSYDAIVRDLLKTAESMLDMGTGGGEKLLEFRDVLPARTFATEGYAPNIPVAEANLQPHGIQVLPYDSEADARMPFDNNSLDLIINRHESYDAREVMRVLRPGGTFLTQQVDGRDMEDLYGLFGTETAYAHVNLNEFQAQLVDAGFVIEMASDWQGKAVFSDVGALVYYLNAIPWEAPEDFTVRRYQKELLALHAKGDLTFTIRRFILKAVKPDSA